MKEEAERVAELVCVRAAGLLRETELSESAHGRDHGSDEGTSS